MIRVLGIDPGLTVTGWGVISAGKGSLSYVSCGQIVTDRERPLDYRLAQIYDGLSKKIVECGPGIAAVEQTVVNLNPSSSLKLGHARGVAILAAAHKNLQIAEYAAKLVKLAVVGTGAASKVQVSSMVRRLLPKSSANSYDAADALAIAICHANHWQTRERLSI